MHSFPTGLLLLTALTFATPACFTIKTGDDDSSSGNSGTGGTGGSSSGGTTSSGGSSGTNQTGGTGGSSGGSSGTGGTGGSSATSGSGGTTTSAVTCSKADLVLTYSCPSGTLNKFTDSVCKQFYTCSFASSCSDAGLDCDYCASFIEGYVTQDDVCSTDSKATVESYCTSRLQAAQADGSYAQCNTK